MRFCLNNTLNTAVSCKYLSLNSQPSFQPGSTLTYREIIFVTPINLVLNAQLFPGLCAFLNFAAWGPTGSSHTLTNSQQLLCKLLRCVHCVRSCTGPSLPRNVPVWLVVNMTVVFWWVFFSSFYSTDIRAEEGNNQTNQVWFV